MTYTDDLRREDERVPEQMPKVYEGDRPYIFACYAHADRDAVLPIIRALVDEGYRVWWDDSIELASDYPEYIADHLYKCACVVVFVSRSLLGSTWCTREIQFAADENKQMLPVYLHRVELTRGIRLVIGRIQSLFWCEFETNEAFHKKLFEASVLDPCLTDEGRRRRGVKPRVSAPMTETQATEVGGIEADADKLVMVEDDVVNLTTMNGQQDDISMRMNHRQLSTDEEPAEILESIEDTNQTGDKDIEANISPVRTAGIMRGSGILFILFVEYTVIGVSYGLLVGDLYLDAFRTVFPTISIPIVTLILSIVGALTGITLVRFIQKKYQPTESEWIWPLLGLFLVPTGTFLLTILLLIIIKVLVVVVLVVVAGYLLVFPRAHYFGDLWREDD